MNHLWLKTIQYNICWLLLLGCLAISCHSTQPQTLPKLDLSQEMVSSKATNPSLEYWNHAIDQVETRYAAAIQTMQESAYLLSTLANLGTMPKTYEDITPIQDALQKQQYQACQIPSSDIPKSKENWNAIAALERNVAFIGYIIAEVRQKWNAFACPSAQMAEYSALQTRIQSMPTVESVMQLRERCQILVQAYQQLLVLNPEIGFDSMPEQN